MGIKGINHLALVTDYMDKTVRFYRDKLGMKVVGTTGREIAGKSFRHYCFSLGKGSTIAFFQWPDSELPPRKDSGVPATGRNFDHLAINLESEADLIAMQGQARAAGIPATDVVDHGIVHSICCEDPNGISLEFSVWMKDLEEAPWFGDPDPVPAMGD